MRHAEAVPDISVVIAAYCAAETVGIAVRSALEQVEVAQVIVVDDCSPDQTLAAARAADDGSGRLVIVSQATNGGPAIARNRGFDMAASDYVAILDADDYFLPGRFDFLRDAPPDWDLAADNIAFATSETHPGLVPTKSSQGTGKWLGIVEFIDANISRPGKRRGELGFLKPVMRREFLDRYRLRYDGRLRLGEDFALYVRALIAGGRFWITSGCGYLALERQDSLSGAHRTDDIACLVQFDEALLSQLERFSLPARALRRHYRYNLKRLRYRAFLDLRRQIGVVRALGAYALKPNELSSVLMSFVMDKTNAQIRKRKGKRARAECAPVRFLMET